MFVRKMDESHNNYSHKRKLFQSLCDKLSRSSIIITTSTCTTNAVTLSALYWQHMLLKILSNKQRNIKKVTIKMLEMKSSWRHCKEYVIAVSFVRISLFDKIRFLYQNFNSWSKILIWKLKSYYQKRFSFKLLKFFYLYYVQLIYVYIVKLNYCACFVHCCGATLWAIWWSCWQLSSSFVVENVRILVIRFPVSMKNRYPKRL